MSYYTRFSLSIGDYPIFLQYGALTMSYADETTLELLEMRLKKLGSGVFGNVTVLGKSSGYGAWYECDEEMIRLSQKFPSLIFVMEGEGEESGDLWKAYYQNGRLQKCKARFVMDDFNPDMLRLPKENEVQKYD